LGYKSESIQSSTYWLIRVNRNLPECESNRLETAVEKAMIKWSMENSIERPIEEYLVADKADWRKYEDYNWRSQKEQNRNILLLKKKHLPITCEGFDYFYTYSHNKL
jgi:hypothetical protein